MDSSQKTIAENRRARFDYEVSETFDAGIELRGFEVKGAKAGHIQLSGSYAIVRGRPPKLSKGGRVSPRAGNELWLINAHIPAYQPKNTPPDYDPGRNRRLLMHSEEIKHLAGLIKERKSSLIPLRAYVKKNLIKIELGLARPRKKSDKREFIKKRSHEREMRQTEE